MPLTPLEVDFIVDTAVAVTTRTYAYLRSFGSSTSHTPLSHSDVAELHEQFVLVFRNATAPAMSDEVSEAFNLYLHSTDFNVWMSHALTVRLLGHQDEFKEALWDEFSDGLASYCSIPPLTLEYGRPLAALLLGKCNDSIPDALDRKIASDAQARQILRDQEINLLLQSIRGEIAHHSTVRASSAREFLSYRDNLRLAISLDVSDIAPPTFDDRRRVPIDDLYVSPTIIPEEELPPGMDSMGEEELLFDIDRTVLLGDPGGGKSTLATKIAFDLSNGARPVSTLCDEGLLGFPIILREYDTFTPEGDKSFVQFMESRSQGKYQLPVPEGSLEWLLETGRLLVIFDGLDELLDTSHRMDVAKRVEAFAMKYPRVPMLVTSRSIGYGEAPLRTTMFSKYVLSGFSADQVQEYVSKWFALSADGGDQDHLADAFMDDSETVMDLRTNPLLLSLMCTIYRNENFIPRNRPQVYEKCAQMLFERWDRDRRIRPELPFDTYIDTAMKDLAYWIFTDESLSSGVTERQLVGRASAFLKQALYTDSDEEAERAANGFIQFCRGRAWVFTDTGTTPEGEAIYQFTHRTFLEYFAASHLVRQSKSVDELMGVLTPRIANAEWDMVAQLAIHQYNRKQADSYGELMSHCESLAMDPTVELAKRRNIMAFVSRCLSHVVGPRDVTTRMVALIWHIHSEVSLEGRDGQRQPTSVPTSLIQPLRSAALDNQVPVIRGTAVHFESVRGNDGEEVFLGALAFLTNSEGAREWPWFMDHWHTGDPELGTMVTRLREWSHVRVWAGMDAFWRSELSLAEFIERFGLETCYWSCEIPGSGIRYGSFAWLAMHRKLISVSESSDNDDWFEDRIDEVLRVMGESLLTSTLRINRGEWTPERVAELVVVKPLVHFGTEVPTFQEAVWISLVMASIAEIIHEFEPGRLGALAEELGSSHVPRMATMISSRFGLGDVKTLPLNAEQPDLPAIERLENWARGELDLVEFA